MGLKLTAFKNGTTPAEEFVEFQATEDVQLSEYAILDQTYDKAGKVSNLHKHFYHLPQLLLRKDQYIRIYTGIGTDCTRIMRSDGNSVYFRYWGMKECIWNNSQKDKLELIRFKFIIKKTLPIVTK